MFFKTPKNICSVPGRSALNKLPKVNPMRFIFMALVLPLLTLTAGCDRGHLNGTRTYSGTVELTEHALGFSSSGRILEIAVEEGEKVSKGQRLATLDHYQQAENDYLRAEKLIGSGGISRQEFEHLSQTRRDMQLISPVDGIVLTKARENGEVTNAGAPVLVIGQTDNVWVKIYVTEKIVSRLNIGQRAQVRIDGLGKTFPAHLSSIAAKAEFTPRNVQTPEERTLQMFGIKVSLDNPDGIRPGVFADVEILDDQRTGH